MEKHFKEIYVCIYEAERAYILWKAICYSRNTTVVPKDLATKYCITQGITPHFFNTIERLALSLFIVNIFKVFDTNKKSYSFNNIDKEATKSFTNNNPTYELLKKLRHQIYAHNDIKKTDIPPKAIPSVFDLDLFFKNIHIFYKKLITDHKINDPLLGVDTDFLINKLLEEIELVFMSIYSFQMSNETKQQAKYENIDLLWNDNPKKISTVFHK